MQHPEPYPIGQIQWPNATSATSIWVYPNLIPWSHKLLMWLLCWFAYSLVYNHSLFLTSNNYYTFFPIFQNSERKETLKFANSVSLKWQPQWLRLSPNSMGLDPNNSLLLLSEAWLVLFYTLVSCIYWCLYMAHVYIIVRKSITRQIKAVWPFLCKGLSASNNLSSNNH